MWTPKRILLLAFGFFIFFSAYQAYAHVLGGIDGLPALPEDCWPRTGSNVIDAPPPSLSAVGQKLQQAFGVGCEELKRPIQFAARSRGIVLAAHEFQLVDGRVKLTKVSLALFGRQSPGKKIQEINTVRAWEAILTFDRPINAPSDMSTAKIIEAELSGQITIVNNRSTPSLTDDIHIDITTTQETGPVYFRDKDHIIYTKAPVHLKDWQSVPPIEVEAIGMDIYLATDSSTSSTAHPATHKAKGTSINGVERLYLRSAVKMHLHVDAQPLMSPGQKPASSTPVQPAAPPKKDHLLIQTNGSFFYHTVEGDVIHAQFDIPKNPSHRYPERVEVIRNPQLEGKRDQLDCEHLELWLRRKNTSETSLAGNDDHMSNLDIDAAHATGQEVVLTSDEEKLECHGNDLFHNRRTGQTIIKGEVEAYLEKEKNRIRAREIELVNQKGAQQMIARGAGQIDMYDKKTGKYPTHATWNEQFQTSREGDCDILIFTRDAVFLDEEHNQKMCADVLKVWLKGPAPHAGPATPGPKSAADSPQSNRRPHRLEARGHVVAISRDMNIHDTDQLSVFFEDLPVTPNKTPVPGLAPAQAGATPAPNGGALIGSPAPAAPDKPANPIDLQAHTVKAVVQRSVINGVTTNNLKELRAETGVHVRQAPSGPDDKGVDITGDILQLVHKPEGNILVVTGDLPKLQLNKITIKGPEVRIDQTTNTVTVTGTGYMTMESSTDFQGNALKQPVPLEVYWKELMFFSGERVDFYGDVEAVQEKSALERALMTCKSMQVYFDRTISLKEGNNKGQPAARVRKLTADLRVGVQEKILTASKRLASFRWLDAVTLHVDNEDSKVSATGPGTVRLVQPGGIDPLQAPSDAPGNQRGETGIQPPLKPAPEEAPFKMTLVKYDKTMIGNNKTRTVKFYNDVRVLHIPTEANKYLRHVDMDSEMDHLPTGGLYLRCIERLTVWSHQEKGRNTQEMEALGQVFVKSKDSKGQDFWGRSDKVTYNEAKDQVIFEGSDGGEVDLYISETRGAPPKHLHGRTIIYSRRTGTFDGSGIHEIQGGN